MFYKINWNILMCLSHSLPSDYDLFFAPWNNLNNREKVFHSLKTLKKITLFWILLILYNLLY